MSPFVLRPAPPRRVTVSVGLVVVVLSACARPAEDLRAPLAGLHPCAAGSTIGVFTSQTSSRSPGDGPAALGFNTRALEMDGTTRPLTDDDVHLGAVISPDGRAVYHLRSSGRVLGDSLETPGVVERLDLATGQVTEVAELPGTVDLAVSGDGRHLAAAHRVEAHPESGLDVTGVTVVDLTSLEVETTLARAPDVPADRFSAVTEVALDPDGGSVAYALAVEVERDVVVNSLRIRDRGTGADTVVHTAPGTDFVSDVEWSADGTTLLAAVRHQEATDTAEDPARLRVLRVDVASGRSTLDEGFAQDFTPLSADGGRLLGIAAPPDAGGVPRKGALVAWERGGGVSRRLPLAPEGTGISAASCSYR
jgi:hypothetical protein